MFTPTNIDGPEPDLGRQSGTTHLSHYPFKSGVKVGDTVFAQALQHIFMEFQEFCAFYERRQEPNPPPRWAVDIDTLHMGALEGKIAAFGELCLGQPRGAMIPPSLQKTPRAPHTSEIKQKRARL
jgi:hypothetical protein